ncbi:protein kinase [Streptomyces sp. ACA25]|uniref:protein kinase domain-containing protein n=1 Tax=Streptomyces sp. ACA25 TaxID=3022596 RepID=UPI0023073F6C|nr:protein kinase [Streptomyces sp. ACA25]MDB1086348.1 protein kinase [Streptomyces sp. ACA25]
MAQERGAPGSGADEPEATGTEVPDSPEYWGNNGLVGDGRYRLTYRLGRGGMAEVFAAEDVRLGRVVAVKLLRSDLAEDPVSKARFTREAQSVAGLNHHAVVAVYDSGEERFAGNVVPYIVMELVDGRTIRELLHEAEDTPVDQALVIVSGVLEALAYSHQHGIVHRDIKPANVIITDTGNVKVMDFGIARALHGAQSTMTQTGMVMGTPQYLSPEQALGKAVDARSDLYAVGCLLYELLAQRPPFTGETPLSVVYQHVQDTPRLPSEMSRNAPPELDGLAMRSLAKDPDDRFQSAEEMRGVVQYALRMLAEHGSHTHGLWNTGSVTADTPAMGTPAVGPGPNATTDELRPMLMGNPVGDGDDGRPGWKNDNRLRYLLVAVLALFAIGAGVLWANGTGDDGDTTPVEDPVPTETAPEEGEEEPEEEPEEPDDNNTGPSDDLFDPSTREPTHEPPSDPGYGTGSGGGTSDGSTGGDNGGSTEGDTDGNTDEGTDDGADDGADEGADEGTPGDPGDGGTTEGNPTGGANPGGTEGSGGPTSGGTADLGATAGNATP